MGVFEMARDQIMAVRIRMVAAVAALLLPAGFASADGACCLENGTCINTSDIDCFVQGGAYSGEGSDCFFIECTGACCLPDETCSELLTRVQCEDLGGTFKGNGLPCAQVACGLRGACCLGDGGCIPQLTYLECTSGFGGTWMGYGLSCSSPSVLNCRGACCFDDGSCGSLLTPDECEMLGGSFRDFGSRCGGGAQDVCKLEDPEALNATLYRQSFNFVMINSVDRNFVFPKFDERGGLRELRRVHIEISGYVLLVALAANNSDAPLQISDGVSISEDLRVRFSSNTTGLPIALTSIWSPELPIDNLLILCDEDELMPGQSCAFQSPYFFPGFGSAIASEEFEPPVGGMRRGASSFVATPSDPTFTVILNPLTGFTTTLDGQGSIQRNPHRGIGDIRVTYEFDLPLGACCMLDGTCVDFVSEEDCTNDPYAFQWTAGRLCSELAALDRPCIVRGACCLCTGECVDGLTELQCDALGVGNHFTLGISCAGIESMGMGCQPRGSCCLPDTSCVWTTEADCDELSAYSIWSQCSSCTAVVCDAYGACFIPGGPCEVRSEQECQSLGGSFLGAGSDCQQFETCDGDANGDQIVDLADLLIVIGNWGSTSELGDVTFDGIVDLEDLLMVISNWGCDSS